MPTYGRFNTVERSIAFFCEQDYENKELIIIDTSPIPLQLGESLINRKDIRLMNIRWDLIDLEPYSNTGAIRRDGLSFATGDLYIGWDDDDLWHPSHISQAVKNLTEARSRDRNIVAYKPKQSLFSGDAGKTFKLAENNMEASVIALIRNMYFSLTSGPEMSGWMEDMMRLRRLAIGKTNPTYCYFWGDGHHKQSGDISNPHNFENHKNAEQDFGDRPLELIDVSSFHKIWDEFHISTTGL